MEELREKLKTEIIESLNLEGVSTSDIENHQQLFTSDLGLDSIDALELIVLLEKNYGIKISSPEEGKKVFESVNTMAEFIEENKK